MLCISVVNTAAKEVEEQIWLKNDNVLTCLCFG